MIGLLVQIQVSLQCTKHALLCVVLYPPYAPSVALKKIAHALATDTFNATVGAARGGGVSTLPEAEPEVEPTAEPTAESEPSGEPEPGAEPEPRAEPEPFAEPPSEYVAEVERMSGSYKGITGQGWQTVVHSASRLHGRAHARYARVHMHMHTVSTSTFASCVRAMPCDRDKR